MKTKKLDFLNKEVSGVILGTMTLFSGDVNEHMEHLDMAVEMGVNLLDTAIGYGGSEISIGKWMKARSNRKDVVVITKGCHPGPNGKRVNAKDLAEDLNRSLERLDTDYIDIYLLHRDDLDLPVGPIVEALNEHFAAGRIKSFGGSNWTHKRIQEANDYAKAHGLEPFRASSPSYFLAEQAAEPWAPGTVTISGPAGEAAREWYAANQMPVFAYSSLARGFFSGMVTRERWEAEKDRIMSPGVLFSGNATKDQLTGRGETIDPICAKAYCVEPNFKRLDRVKILAEEKGRTIAQIALAFIVNSKMNVFPVSGVANRAELQSTIDAVNIELTDKELAWLDLKIDNR
ncbi:aryl-alcohol dehydrogenase-like predicted oxidoreductase [Anaerobacterium chartisolvens]|uniref:Aryl-alcohol dehydrogenase-like predicted oxidoreductase n=1 Tax=Anaerobacterium chartisolvens TaxID=1297424 RepID=A0A369AL98_9FIRM|nr:aldo/keto reductase [Anaerobacterium chartisolvens]RCX09865.1 aryl-alcohol dehydrogenase-like predicted oxidoreductase [Anaerobacterium chartisolvens]